MPQKLRFINNAHAAFFSTTRLRVDTYFKEHSLSKHANTAMWGKTIFFLASFVSVYLLILLGDLPVPAMAALGVLLGVLSACIGFNICHDAIHGAFSSDRRVNKTLGLIFNFIGANPYVWSITHNQVHHTYTNIPGHDEDLEIAPGLVRITEDEPLSKMHRYQHLYGLALYGLASLSWVLRKDYVKFFQKSIGQVPTLNHPRKEYFNLFFYKAVYYGLFIALPLVVLDVTWWQFALGFLLMHFAEGMVLGSVFQLAHVVEGTSFPEPNLEGNIEESWAAHQMQTTANFAPRSAFAAFFCGGLNRQIEHHLFPKICHIHYPAISGIVQETALEFGLPYLENKSFLMALRSHHRLLLRFGKEEHEKREELSRQPAFS
ncbi:fatty acid desaturase family protein [Rufibacter latericius]|uniref:Acyl-CoA desaturase n=1 Tax=Rufibacter latericius TaxID=2487040 RepID=A0A3M9MND5_9BACT|nr:acyl-CoA desaturase [Rufibacter latericius]RNI27046.1 acyl-CoA desaturase [Rufibacter latericius]